jgi:hypothetical protein
MPRKPLSNAGATYKASTGFTGTKAWQQRGPAFYYPAPRMSGTETVGILVAPALQIVPARSSGAILLRTQLSAVRDGSGTDSGTSGTGTHVRSRLFRHALEKNP